MEQLGILKNNSIITTRAFCVVRVIDKVEVKCLTYAQAFFILHVTEWTISDFYFKIIHGLASSFPTTRARNQNFFLLPSFDTMNNNECKLRGQTYLIKCS